MAVPGAALCAATKNARAVLVPELSIGQLRLEVERLLGRDKVEGLHQFSGEPITPAQIAARATALASEA